MPAEIMTPEQFKAVLEPGAFFMMLLTSEAESIKGLDYILTPEITDNASVMLTGKYAKNIKVLQDAGWETADGYRIEGFFKQKGK